MGKRVVAAGANRLLEALSPVERRRLERVLAPAPLAARQVLHEAGRPVEHLHFPGRGCLVALVARLGDGRSLRAGVVGHEGAVGVEVALGAEAARFAAVVVVPGASWRLDADAARAEVRRGGPLAGLLHRYVEFLLVQLTQISGCNRFHVLEQHFASLLLVAQDRTGADEFAITHELVARLIGVRRVGVTQAARRFQQAGLIRYRWGKVAILDRRGLEARACVCHREIERASRGLPGPA